MPPEERRIGMVFQDFALFPHLTVAGNVGFGFGRRPVGQGARSESPRCCRWSASTGAGDTYPHELSGGQQQRVALARALAPEPDLLLLDEPFSNLDIDLRERLSLEVRDIIKASGTTAILVTHDQHEAFALADEIGIMHDGRIEQWDAAYELYHRPATRFVADFVGQGVFLRGTVHGSAHARDRAGRTRQPTLPLRRTTAVVDVLLRPDDIVHDDDEPVARRGRRQGVPRRRLPVHVAARLGHARAVARAVASRSRHRREDRDPPGDRSRRRVSGASAA